MKLGGEDAPQVDEVIPSVVRPGEETELRVRGRRLAPGMALSFGKDIALVAPLASLKPGWAIAKVFVAPTAHPASARPRPPIRPGGVADPPGWRCCLGPGVPPRPSRPGATVAPGGLSSGLKGTAWRAPAW